jgi:hypothetical protein
MLGVQQSHPCSCLAGQGVSSSSGRAVASVRTGKHRSTSFIMQAAAEQVAAAQPQQQQPSPTQFLRPHLLKLAAYTPIEPFEILSARYGRSPQDIVKLDANENPYGPPPEVLQALANMPFPHIYPDPETRRLRAALAEWNDIPKEHLLVSSRKHGCDVPCALACDHRRKHSRQHTAAAPCYVHMRSLLLSMSHLMCQVLEATGCPATKQGCCTPAVQTAAGAASQQQLLSRSLQRSSLAGLSAAASSKPTTCISCSKDFKQ